MKIKELPMDQKTTITLLLTSIEEKETRNSSPYCTLTLTDGIDTIIAQLWNTKKENVKVQEKTLISAEIYKKMYNESVSFNSVLNYWIHYYIDHTNCSRPVYIMALIRRNYYVTKKLERCYINLR